MSFTIPGHNARKNRARFHSYYTSLLKKDADEARSCDTLTDIKTATRTLHLDKYNLPSTSATSRYSATVTFALSTKHAEPLLSEARSPSHRIDMPDMLPRHYSEKQVQTSCPIGGKTQCLEIGFQESMQAACHTKSRNIHEPTRNQRPSRAGVQTKSALLGGSKGGGGGGGAESARTPPARLQKEDRI